MSHSKLRKVIDAWKKGNEVPFSRYYYRLYKSVMPKLERLTLSKADAEDIFMEGIFTFLRRFFLRRATITR